MILCVKTDSPVCEVTLYKNEENNCYTWEAGRELARDLLAFLEGCLEKNNASWDDLEGIVVFRGPGSFTGLRIGITVANAIAYAKDIPVVGELGESWQENGMQRLQDKQNDRIILPEYGREVRITQPRK